MDAVLLGPGLGRSEELTRLVQAVLSVCRVPLVLDADGINAAAPHIDVLRGCACPVVLTPHDGEFLRLGGDPKAADRTQEAMRLANRTHAVLLLKGSPDGHYRRLECLCKPYRKPRPRGRRQRRRARRDARVASGPAYHAAGGSCPQPHGCTAPPPDLAAQELGEYGMVPEDLLLRIPRLLP